MTTERIGVEIIAVDMFSSEMQKAAKMSNQVTNQFKKLEDETKKLKSGNESTSESIDEVSKSQESLAKETDEVTKAQSKNAKSTNEQAKTYNKLNKTQKTTLRDNKKLSRESKTLNSQTKKLKNQAEKLKDTYKKLNKTQNKVSTGARKTSSSFGSANNSMKTAITSFGSMNIASVALAGGLVGVGVAAARMAVDVTKGIFSVSEQMEVFELQFQTVLGTQKLAIERMQELGELAAFTPLQLEQLSKASRTLEVLTKGALSTGEGLTLVGDNAAISGESIELLSVHIGRLYSGLRANRPVGESMMRLQELGLVSAETRNQIEALQKQAKGKEAWLILEKELERNRGGMKLLSESAVGMKSTIVDLFKEIGRQLGRTGIFDVYKDGLNSIRTGLTNIVKSGIIETMSDNIKNVTSQFYEWVKIPFDFVVDHLKAIKQLTEGILALNYDKFKSGITEASKTINDSFNNTYDSVKRLSHIITFNKFDSDHIDVYGGAIKQLSIDILEGVQPFEALTASVDKLKEGLTDLNDVREAQRLANELSVKSAIKERQEMQKAVKFDGKVEVETATIDNANKIKQRQKQIATIRKEYAQINMNTLDKQLDDIERNYKERFAIVKGNAEAEGKLFNVYQNQILQAIEKNQKNINNNIENITKDRRQIQLTSIEKEVDDIKINNQKKIDELEKVKKLEFDIYKTKIDIAKNNTDELQKIENEHYNFLVENAEARKLLSETAEIRIKEVREAPEVEKQEKQSQEAESLKLSLESEVSEQLPFEDKMAKLEEQYQIERDLLMSHYGEVFGLEQAHAQRVIELKENQAQKEQQIAQQRINFGKNIVNTVGNLLKIGLGNSKEAAAIQKGVAIANIMFDTYQAAQKVFLNEVMSNPTPAGFGSGAAKMGAVITQGIANSAIVASQKLEKGGIANDSFSTVNTNQNSATAQTGGVFIGPEHGDKNIVAVNGGEMVTTKQQQLNNMKLLGITGGFNKANQEKLFATINGQGINAINQTTPLSNFQIENFGSGGITQPINAVIEKEFMPGFERNLNTISNIKNTDNKTYNNNNTRNYNITIMPNQSGEIEITDEQVKNIKDRIDEIEAYYVG